MKIVHLKLTQIKPYKRNPRLNDGAVDGVAESIRQFGFRVPIIVDRKRVIICGHTRYKAAQKLGLKTVPVHIAEDLTPAQVRAYRLADNKLGEKAQWDTQLLPVELEAVQNDGFDLELIGFDKIGANGPGDQSGDLDERFEVLVICQSERAQNKLLDRLSKEGYECRSLIS